MTLATQELQDSLVSPVPLESKGRRARRGSPTYYRQTLPAVTGENLGIQDSVVFQDLQVYWVFKDLLVQEESEEDQDHQGPQDHKDHKATGALASMEKKANRDPQVHQVHPGFLQEN